MPMASAWLSNLGIIVENDDDEDFVANFRYLANLWDISITIDSTLC